MTEQDKKELQFEIDCIFESGANEIRIFEMVERFIKQRSLINTLPIHDVVCVFCGHKTDGNSFNEDAEPCHLSCLEKQEDYEKEYKEYKDLLGY